jgi:hypothetical protein
MIAARAVDDESADHRVPVENPVGGRVRRVDA